MRFKKIAVAIVMVGALAVTGTGVASAAQPKDPAAYGMAAFEKHFDCAKANQRLTHVQRLELGPAAKLTKLIAAEAKAEQVGHKRHGAWLQKMITAEQARIAKGMNPRFKARLDKYASIIENKCHVALPAFTPRAANPKPTPGKAQSPKTSSVAVPSSIAA